MGRPQPVPRASRVRRIRPLRPGRTRIPHTSIHISGQLLRTASRAVLISLVARRPLSSALLRTLMKTLHAALALATGLLAPPLAGAAEPAPPKKTALDDYIAKADPTYSWKLVATIPGDGVTTFVLDLKSQTWRAPPEVDRAVWQHWLVIVKPDKVKHDTAFLRIGGGRNGSAAPKQTNPQSALFARATGTVVADLGMIPNQPLVF